MAKLLQRLGRSSAKHAPITVIVWVLALVGAVLFGTLGGGEYSTSMSIPGTRSQDLADRLEDELPDAARGTGTMTFVSADGGEIDEDQQAQIGQALEAAEGVDGVHDMLNPFTTQEEMEAQIAQAESGAEELESGAAELEAGRAEAEQGQELLDAAREELEAGRAQLEEALAQLPDVPADQLPPEVAAQVEALESQMAEIEAGEAELDAQQETLDAGMAEIEAGEEQLEQGRTMLENGERMLNILGDYSVVSSDGTAAIATVTFEVDAMSVTTDTKNGLMDAIDSHLGESVEVYYSQSIDSDLSNIVGVAEIIGIVMAAIVLFVMLRTIITAALPILTALVGVAITVMVSTGLAGFIEMHEISPILGIMLGLAVGIDYTLFVVNRHRQQLLRGHPIDESIGLAVGTSGNAVVFAGLTVITALVALNIIGIPFLGVLGNVAALAVLIAVLLTITFTPAILHFLGYRVLPKKKRAEVEGMDRVVEASEVNDSRPVPAPARRPWLTTVLAIGLLAVLAIPFFSMRLGLPDGSNEPEDSGAYESYMITSEAFGPGFNGPHIVAADLPDMEEAERQEVILDVGEQLFEFDEIVSVIPGGVSEDGDMTVYQVIGTTGPSDVETEELVQHVRDMSPITVGEYSIPIEVTGQTAMQIDVSENLGDALPIYLAIIIAISFVLLVLVFRSILVPLAATAGFLFSVLAAMGTVVAIYQWGWLGDIFGVSNPGPILSFLPTIMVGILFGLAMDYQLFLTTGMREAWVHGRPAKKAVVDGLYAARAVVIAAALIMFSVFAGFIFSEMSMVRPIGFGLAIGVLLDAFVVRMALIPAALTILGEKAWWIPAWLEKILPEVDVEGASIERSDGNGNGNGNGNRNAESSKEKESVSHGKHARPADDEPSTDEK